MAYTEKQKAKLKPEVESGLLSKSKLAQKWRMSRNTLNKIIQQEGWVFGINVQELSKVISKKTEDKLAEKYSNDLEDFTEEHIKSMDEVGSLTKKSLERLRDAVEAEDSEGKENRMSKDQAEAIFSQQKVLKISSETLSIIYADKRKALGLDKPKEDPAKTDLEERIRLSMERDGFK